MVAQTSYSPVFSNASSGCLMSIWCVSVGKYSSKARLFTMILPDPGVIHTRATASFRRPVA